jgi:hypothetical protein
MVRGTKRFALAHLGAIFTPDPREFSKSALAPDPPMPRATAAILIDADTNADATKDGCAPRSLGLQKR